MSSYVDMNSEVHWPDQAHNERVELVLRSAVTHLREHVLDRRLISVFAETLSLLMPPAPTDGTADRFAAVRPLINGIAAYFQPLTPAAMQELGAAASVLSTIDALAEQARADSDLLDKRRAYDATRRQRDALPPVPVADPVTGIVPPDPLSPDDRAAVEAQRTALQATLDGSPQATKDEVARHDAWVAAQSGGA